MARKISLSWTLVAFVLIGGGIGLCAFVMAASKLGDPWFGHAGYFVGALLGGYTCGRVSPGITVIEPALAGFLLTGLLFGFFGLSPDSSIIWKEGTGVELLHRAVSLGGLCLLGGLVGALAGERASERSTQGVHGIRLALRQIWISFLSYVGLLLTGTVVFMIVMQTTDQTLVDSPGLFLLGFCAANVGAGVVAQSMSPKRMLLASASGPFFMYLAIGVAATVHRGDNATIAVFMVLGGAGLSVLSIIGAAVTHGRMKARAQPVAKEPPLATARLAGGE